MSTCPQCHQPIESQTLRCPHCHTLLKAYGHSGIPLHQAQGETFLCDSCTYHEDDTCTFPQRPHAKNCTLYQDKYQAAVAELELTYSRKSGNKSNFKGWCQSNRGWLILLGLVAISFLIALSS